jgi:hypothetical protein
MEDYKHGVFTVIAVRTSNLTLTENSFILHTIITFLDIKHHPVFYSKHTMFRRLDSVSVFR